MNITINNGSDLNPESYSVMVDALGSYKSDKFNSVVLLNGHNEEKDPEQFLSNDTMYIIAYSSPKGEKRKLMTISDTDLKLGKKSVKFGKEAGSRYVCGVDKFFKTAPKSGGYIFANKLSNGVGYPIATIKANSIFLHLNLYALKKENIRYVLDYILSKSKSGLKPPTKRYVENMKIEKLGRILVNNMKVAKKNAERNIKSYESNLRTHQVEVKNYTDKLALARASLTTEIKKVGDSKQIRKVLDMLLDTENVEEIEIFDNVLEVYTKPLTVENDGSKVISDSGQREENRKVVMGRYCIRMKTGGDVSIFNLDVSVENNAYHHPHITSGGSPCWGNMSGIKTYVAQGEYNVAVSMLLQYLENVHGADTYQSYDEWVRCNGKFVKESLKKPFAEVKENAKRYD